MVYSYDPSEVQLSYAGREITGFPDGTFINIVPDAPLYNIVTGIDGAVCYIPRSSFTAKVTIRLQQGAMGNQILTAVAALNQKGRTVKGKPSVYEANLTLIDPSNTFNLELGLATLLQDSSVSFGKVSSEGIREWTFHCPNVKYKNNILKPNRSENTTPPPNFVPSPNRPDNSTLSQGIDLIIDFFS